jgi:hypothetical protein
MSRSNILGTLLATALGLWIALPAAAEEKPAQTQAARPCAADTAKFCKDIKPGGGRVKACLAEHAKELSKPCTERLQNKKDGKHRSARAGQRGGKDGFACAAAYKNGFSSGFVRAARMGGLKGRGAFGQRLSARRGGALCKADAQKLCAGVKPGAGRVKDCLRQNLGKLSENCKARQEKSIEKEKAAEKEAKV